MKKQLLIIMALLLPMVVTARIYTLDECRKLSLENNAKIKIAGNDQQTASADKWEAFTNFLPSVSIAGGGMKSTEPMMKMQMGDMSMSMLDGGWYGSAMLSLPLFAGGRIYNGYQMAKLGVEISDLQRRQTENEVRLTVNQYYWQIVTLKEKLKTLQSMKTLLDNIIRDVNNAVEAGVTKPNDLLQAKLRSNDNHSVSVDIEKNIEIARMMLAQVMGVPADDLEIEANIDSELVAPEGFYTDHLSAVELTPEYQLLSKSVEAAERQKKIARGEFLPTVSVSGGYMFQNMMGPSQNSLMGMLTVSIPISWKTKSTMRKQSLAVENATTQLNDGHDQLIIKMQAARNGLESAYQQALIAKTSIEQAAENLRLNENYYKAGISTMSDLLEAQALYQQSRDKYAEAYSTYEIKKTEYLLATGR